MGFVTYLNDGIVSNTSAYADSKYLIISHPLSTDSLAIAEFDLDGYESSLAGFTTSAGRTLSGLIKVEGGGYLPKEQWVIKSCTVKELQLELFDALLAYQTVSKQPCSLQDLHTKYQYIFGYKQLPTWVGTPTGNALGHLTGFTAWNVWIDIDQGYKKDLGYQRYNLAFQANQV